MATEALHDISEHLYLAWGMERFCILGGSYNLLVTFCTVLAMQYVLLPSGSLSSPSVSVDIIGDRMRGLTA